MKQTDAVTTQYTAPDLRMWGPVPYKYDAGVLGLASFSSFNPRRIEYINSGVLTAMTGQQLQTILVP